MPLDPSVRTHYLDYLKSPEFDPYLKRLAGRPLASMILAFLTFMTTIGIPVSFYYLYKAFTHRKRYRKHLIAVAERSVPLMTYPLMTNSMLRTHPGAIVPGLVIGSFDPAVSDDFTYMSDLALDILAADAESESPELREAAALMEDIVYRPHRRRLLPKGLTQGHEVYAFDLMFVGDYLPEQKLETPFIPCVAEPGAQGEIHMIPITTEGLA